MQLPILDSTLSRRTLLRQSACGFGAVALQSLLTSLSKAAATPSGPHHAPKAKRIIFLSMAGSFVGAGVVWKFIYAYRPAGAEQIGLLNQIVTVLGLEPKGWLLENPINNLALIVVGLWIWTGYCMVILSAAYKGIPKELMEAGQVDGANDWQVFRHIIVPEMRPALTMVTTTMLVNVLKIFDIIYVMTNGNFGTEVIANRMFKEMFQFANTGRASAIAVVLFMMIIPIMYANVRQKLKGEGSR